MAQLVDVAVGVLCRADGRVLLAQRPAKKVYSGYWEFPGGKVEPGEAVAVALAREIREELGVRILCAYPWIVRRFVYPHAAVRLSFFRVTSWRGDLRPLEFQSLSWEDPKSIGVAPLLPANGPVLKLLQLPAEYAISQTKSYGVGGFLQRLESRLAAGLRLVQIREKDLQDEELRNFAKKVVGLARRFGAMALINSDPQLALDVGADGLHLDSRLLWKVSRRPEFPWCSASCHDASDIRRAESLGMDFAVLGPVNSTPSHPDGPTLGWEGFQAAATGAEIPVYAIGGMTPDLLETACAKGAHGLAMIRGSWKSENEAGS